MNYQKLLLSSLAMTGLVLVVGCQSTVDENRDGVPAPLDGEPSMPVAEPAPLQPLPEAPIVTPNTDRPGIVENETKMEIKNVPEKPVSQIPPFKLVGDSAKKIVYTVKRGDSLWSVARAYGISQNELAAENNLGSKAYLKIGQKITIPAGGVFIPESKRPPIKYVAKKTTVKPVGKKATPDTMTAKSNAVAGDGVYVVVKGDSISKIAKTLKVSQADLMSVNNLKKSSVLQIGQKLQLPSGVSSGVVSGVNQTNESSTSSKKIDSPMVTDTAEDWTKAGEPGGVPSVGEISSSTVEAIEGETLNDLANTLLVSLDELKKLNPTIKEDQKLKKGTVVKIPSF